MHTPLTICLQTAPGGIGLTVGENDWSPPGRIAFCVEDGAAGLVLAGVEAGLDGASFSLVELHAVKVPITARADPPMASAIRRLN